MESHKTSRYFKYAVGEIILVMIGILLALQVNDWNESRKAKLQEVKILKELNNDLTSNLAEVEETIFATQLRLKASENILDYINNALEVDDSLKVAVEMIQNDGIFNNSNTAYEYIKNKGFDVLSNDSIRIKISNMYERHLNNIIVRERANLTIVNEELLPFLTEHFKSSPSIYADFSYHKILNTPHDIEDLRKNEVFKNIIIRFQNYLILRAKWQEFTLVTLKKLISDIDNEIERLN